MSSSPATHSRQLDFYEAMADFSVMFPSLEEEVFHIFHINQYPTKYNLGIATRSQNESKIILDHRSRTARE